MGKMFPKLFERGNIGKLEVPNRVIKAATMTAFSNTDGSANDYVIKFHAETARGGCGLVIGEGTSVMEGDSFFPTLCAADASYIPGLSLLAQAIADNGAKSALQLVPGGNGVPSRIAWFEIEDQANAHWLQEGGTHRQPIPRELTIEDIEKIIESTGNAANVAKIAGFDMIEIHASHGVPAHQFLSPARNIRNDLYGGSMHNRMRFLVEIVQIIKKRNGADYPIGVRISAIDYEPGGITLDQSVEIAKGLEKAGVDLLHISGGSHSNLVHMCSPMSIPLGYHVAAAEAIKKVVNIPVVASGSITNPKFAEEILKSGKADFIAIARPLFADPHWAKKAKEGRPEDIAPCIRCVDGCQGRSNLHLAAIRCTVNPALGREDSLALIPAKTPKSVAVIGGGPAGMEAARVLTLRGHNVTLYEHRKLGGVLIEGSTPDFKADIRSLIAYYETQIKKLKIKVLNETATVDTIKKGKFDAVIVASGAIQFIPELPGINKPLVASAMSVLQGKTKVGKRVHIVGGGIIGVEVGLFLAQQDKEIIFTTRQDRFIAGNGTALAQEIAHQEMLSHLNVKILTGRKLESVSDEGAVVVDKNGNKQTIAADTVVLATGLLPQTALRDQIEKETDIPVYAIGDCMGARMIYDAIHEGFTTARMI